MLESASHAVFRAQVEGSREFIYSPRDLSAILPATCIATGTFKLPISYEVTAKSLTNHTYLTSFGSPTRGKYARRHGKCMVRMLVLGCKYDRFIESESFGDS